MTTTIETSIVRRAPGMEFDVSIAGNPGRPLVLMLHGFCVSRHYWESQAVALAEAGYFAAARNQRGYAPGARPDPAEHANYMIDELIGDVMAIVSGLGHGERRFHLAGHDWGGSLSWNIAERWPERLGSLTMLSRPHPLAFNRAMREDPAATDTLCSSQMAAGARGRGQGPGGRRALGACAAAPQRGAGGGDREAHLGYRQPSGDGGRDRLVPRPRYRAWAGGPHARADPTHLGRCRRHGRPHGGRRHRRVHRGSLHVRPARRRGPLRG